MGERPKFIGFMAGASGIAIAVLTLRPEEWVERIVAWRDTLGIYIVIGMAFTIGVFSVWSWMKWRGSKPADREELESTGISILTQESFGEEAHRLLQDDAPMVVKVFGYTGETALNDVFRFDDRYRSNLDVRFLHRNWLVERDDEERQNALFPDRRPWRKSNGIRQIGTETWIHSQRRQFRYYNHQPSIKGLIVTKVRTDEKVLFLSFFRWVKDPEEGGSAFKGINLPFICIRGTGRQAELFIEGVESQFDYEWRHCVGPEKIESLIESGGQHATGK